MKKLLTSLTTCYLLLTTVPKALAAGSFNVDLGSQVSSRVAINNDLGTFISRVFSAVIIVAGLATFVYMIYGGLQWVMSGGEKDKLNEARGRITQAIVGLAVVASAWAIYKLIDYFFGIGIAK